MRIPRLFTDTPLRPGSELRLAAERSRYLAQVLRLRPGDRLVLFDGAGRECRGELTGLARQGAQVRLLDCSPPEPEPRLQVHLGLGVSKGERMDLAIQKSVELGVAAITPLFTRRAVVRLEGERLARRLAHWRGVVIAASEQSGRRRLARLHPAGDLAGWLGQDPGDPGLLLHHRARKTLVDLPPPPAGRLRLLVGPEGGLTGEERTLAEAAGFTAVRLGPRVLRTETAPLAALACLQLLWGDFRDPPDGPGGG